MAEASLNVLVGSLCSLIQAEIGLIIGVDEEMKKLSSTLTAIQAVLEDAEIKQLQSKSIHNWLVKLNDLAYDIDDILDECATEVLKLEHISSKSRRYSLKKLLFQRKIGRRMKRVTQQLDAVAAERDKFHLRETTVRYKPIEFAAARETGSSLNEPHLVYGREEDTEKIVGILVNQVKDNRGITILPIIGVGGLGKTTLAQLVYKDQRVVEHFDKRIWVCVSGNFDLKTVMKAMIESGTANSSDLMHLDSIQHCLWELLNQKRYLLVLDDVWNEDQQKWSELRNALACGSNGSSIIITTRLKKVVDIMGTLPPHYLTGLSEEHCWTLLRERALGQDKDKFSNLEPIGNQIVKKCAGVPLAAKALGGLLRFKRTENEWNYVKESEIWVLPQEENLILPALRLSYYHLPLELRQCFAYCAVFPKGTFIRKDELIFMWMAHGYISSKGVLEVEDVGNEICNELVLRSLLQIVTGTNIKTNLIMHDLVHDLAQSIMEDRTTGAHIQRNLTSTAPNSKIRQVNLRKKSVAFPTSNQPEMDMPFILTKFCRLRILDASRTGINELSYAVGRLKHLRHLNLSETGIRTLPESLSSLCNLQVLNLDYCKDLVALPKKTRCLINLRHLLLESCKSLKEMPSKIGELTCLRTLSLFVVGRDRGNRLEELQGLNLGGRLTISHLERVENPVDANKANLREKKNLHRLSLVWGSDNIASKLEVEERDEKVLESLEPHRNLKSLGIRGFGGRFFPIWMSNSTLDKVVEIHISYCENCLRLPQLGELPHLKSLTLDNVAAVEYIIEGQVRSGNTLCVNFPSLETLYLRSLPNLKGLSKEETTREAFPNLEKLCILHCSSLVMPPLSYLKKLKTLSCSSSTLASLSNLYTVNLLLVDIDKNTTCIPIKTLQNLTSLDDLWIYGAHELCLPEEGLKSLKSLKRLHVVDSEKLACLPQCWLRNLTCVEELEVSRCSEIVDLPEGIKYLRCLKELKLDDLSKMVRVPEALQHIAYSLQSLKLHRLHVLSSLPEWLDGLKCLESLDIYDCSKIASIPDSVKGMTNLRYLCVEKCSELERRCERGDGEDWHKIAHIPRLQIGER
ncbi:hypothetical protein ABFS82_03G020200 [Erythranthe guttata]|uniref:putative disease resistance protein RGA4 n=1 Tax=Erythranthe guttata TaxID=4155 RepID=UPI00064DF060|nr:PREDICTED: putative disease resistance protein RGA4 [Erythranthe guttata]|eukprot:XP_012854401.1 PREDICTED: putative disease resistance protein RGA4 [Erythranthe guttata]